MKVLISPAKSIDINRDIDYPKTTKSAFLNDSKIIMNVLKKWSTEEIKSKMHVSNDIAELNLERNNNWEPPVEKNKDTCPAIIAFTGEVYRGLDVNTFSEKDFLKAQETIRILSGLYGILKPLDLIFAYRLEMGTKIQIDERSKNLYQFWGNKLADFLAYEMENQEVLVNLASNEYAKAVPFKSIKNQIITPHFKDFKNGELKTVSVYAKHARGEMARWIVKNNIESAEEIKLFNKMGYLYDHNLSTEEEFVFTR